MWRRRQTPRCEEANSTLAEKNQVVALDNVKQITDIVRIAEDATLVKLKRFKASITDCVRAVFEAVADDIQKEDLSDKPELAPKKRV